MADDTLLGYRELINELRRYCLEKRTGSVMIVTPENQLVRFLLADGQIQSVTIAAKQGRAALPLVKDIKAGRLRFSDAKGGLQPDPSLPSTQEILLELGGNAAPVAARPSQSVDNDRIPAILRAIEDELVEVLGPMAGIVWAERLVSVDDITRPGAINKLADDLATEIDDPQKAKRFKDQVSKILSA